MLPGKRYVDWPLDDPAGQGVDAVRPIRDEIAVRVRGLMAELGVRPRGLSRRTDPDRVQRSGRATCGRWGLEPTLGGF